MEKLNKSSADYANQQLEWTNDIRTYLETDPKIDPVQLLLKIWNIIYKVAPENKDGHSWDAYYMNNSDKAIEVREIMRHMFISELPEESRLLKLVKKLQDENYALKQRLYEADNK